MTIDWILKQVQSWRFANPYTHHWFSRVSGSMATLPPPAEWCFQMLVLVKAWNVKIYCIFIQFQHQLKMIHFPEVGAHSWSSPTWDEVARNLQRNKNIKHQNKLAELQRVSLSHPVTAVRHRHTAAVVLCQEVRKIPLFRLLSVIMMITDASDAVLPKML